MPVRLVAMRFDAIDPDAAAAFWSALLERPTQHDGDEVLLPAVGTQVGLRFVAAEVSRTGPHRVHLHLTSTSLADQRATVAAALALGAEHLDVGQLPEEEHVVLADPDGNELCVIEPGEPYLAGCGFLAELTGEGSREVGLFWQAALDWPLVWDKGLQTVVQSPEGGTKIAWDGEPDELPYSNRKHGFDLAADDPAAEATRLIALGAREMAGEDGVVHLADPDGNAIRISRG